MQKKWRTSRRQTSPLLLSIPASWKTKLQVAIRTKKEIHRLITRWSDYWLYLSLYHISSLIRKSHRDLDVSLAFCLFFISDIDRWKQSTSITLFVELNQTLQSKSLRQSCSTCVNGKVEDENLTRRRHTRISKVIVYCRIKQHNPQMFFLRAKFFDFHPCERTVLVSNSLP